MCELGECKTKNRLVHPLRRLLGTRSPGYPSLSLRVALEKVQAIWNAQQKHSAHMEAVMTTIGYSKKTGPSLRAVSALHQFGLTRETGSVDSRMIGLSDAAINYLHATDDQERLGIVRQAALKPTIFQHLWEHYGPILPNDETIKNHLIRDKNFNSAAVGELISNYRDTFDFAKLRDNGVEDEKPDIRPPQVPLTARSTQSIPPKPKPQGMPPMSENTRYLSIPLEVGDAPVPLGMSKQDWEIFISTLKVWKARILASAEMAEDPAIDASLDELKG